MENYRRTTIGFSRAAAPWETLPMRMVFIFIGRMAPVKNVPGLVEGVPRWYSPRAACRSRLLIVGDGEDHAAVRELIESHPFGHRVVLAGEQADVRSYLAAADGLRSEFAFRKGPPRALLEAMAVGLPGHLSCRGQHSIDDCWARGWLTDASDPAPT